MMVLKTAEENVRPRPDAELIAIADYVSYDDITSDLAYYTARFSLMDALGCAILALQYPACTKLLGPIIQDTIVPLGVRVPGTSFHLDPILAAFNIGTMVRWLDFNDTWLAAEWGHPSDNLGAILAIADYRNQKNLLEGHPPLLMRDVLTAMIKAYEIQGILALENSFNRLGYDHVLLVKIASTALATHLLGGTHEQIIDALSQAWIDGACLRTYRHAPNTGSRKSWAAGDATSRATRLAWLTMQNEMGYPSVLSTKKWGFYDAMLKGQSLRLSRPFKAYVMENILFKIAYPAEFHAQTAIEAATQLHPKIVHQLDQIDKIIITTQEPSIRIISKTGPLYNPADRDHCLQYMVAVALLKGHLTADDYEDQVANDKRIDTLRSKMIVQEDKQFSCDYLDQDKRSIANSIQIYFADGSFTEKMTVEYPLGHRCRREESIPFLYKKFEENLASHYPSATIQFLLDVFHDQKTLEQLPVNQFIDLFAV